MQDRHSRAYGVLTQPLAKRMAEMLKISDATKAQRMEVDHEMLAAGHPDVTFELDSFSSIEPPHWVEKAADSREPIGDKLLSVRIWSTGQATQLEAGMTRLARHARGVILVPKQVVERMENDSQLAAVLADSVAALQEDLFYKLKSLRNKVMAAELAELAIPIAGGAAGLATSKGASDAERRIQERAARVSLGLMKDAGYELSEAPRAWWILSTKEAKSLAEVSLPERVQYLYQLLGTTWRAK